ncbi:protein translocase subunit SecF [Candidatus Peregrinibacteria bacterium]|nr:protein translocase subunit SecF [Candidatus Peregrinibacteria bacterium]
MGKYFSPKIIIIIVSAILLGFFDLSDNIQKTIFPQTSETISKYKVHLGLDLQGGTQLDYKIDLRKVPEKDRDTIEEGVKEVINKRVNSLGVSEPNIYSSKIGDESHIIVELAGIKDIEKAKETVGKIIQLEFKEEKAEPDPQEKEKILALGSAALGKLLSQENADFSTIGKEEEQANLGKVQFTEPEEYKFQDQLQGEIAQKAFEEGRNLGEIIPELIEIKKEDNEYTVNETGQLALQQGYAIYKLIDKIEEERKIEHEKEVKASHILIAYQGAERADETITRTEEEAKTRAEEVLKKVQEEGDFAALAKEYSDDSGSKEKGGDLGFFKQAAMVKEFSDKAFSLEKGAISDLVKSSFGYHIIQVNDIKEAISETKIEPKVKLSRIFYSSTPDPWKDTGLTGEHFQRADVQFDNLYNPYVTIKFNDEGAKLFEQITERNTGKRVAIFVGGELISAPTVNEKISGGSAQISGTFTLDEATKLARDLNTGAIPAPITLSGQYTIGASLGQEALSQSLKAGLIGFIILCIFMIAVYRLPGLLASLALIIYSAILLFLIKVALPLYISVLIAAVIFIVILMKILKSDESGWEKSIAFILDCFILFFVTFLLSTPIVLTLAGIAGVILSIGMAVDANVLIFERLKEELKEERPLNSAIDIGFNRAWSSIRDSNFSSLITCGILFYFGSSIIQGFALNLAMGILVSMFTAITITKTFLKVVLTSSLAKNLWLFGFKKEKKITHFDFMKRSKTWFSFSGAMIGISIISMIAFGLKLGLDFTGGTLMEFKFENQNIEAQALRDAIKTSSLDIATSSVIVPTDQKTFLVRTKHIDNEIHDSIIKSLQEKFGTFEEPRFTTIGPTIGKTLQKRAIYALSLALIMIILYIAFAFRKIPKRINPWRFGICAIIALIHDVIITIGAYVLLGKFFGVEIDALFITALLTIIGFSVHDTIVVFDRIRENLRIQEKGESFDDIANKAMNQTLGRSINTSLTTLLVITSIFIFGAPSIRYFILALLVGITVGTYSSIFTASPLLVFWRNWDLKRNNNK